METVKNTKAGVLSWTPAPVCISPASSETSEEWNGGEEQDQDFYSQMDENGIIGLIQERDDDTECIQVSPSPKSYTQEDVTTSGYEVQHMPPEESVYSLNGQLEDFDGLSTFADDVSTLNEQSHREDSTNETKLSKEGQKTERFSEREKFFEMAPGKKDRAEGERGFRIESPHHNKDEPEIISERHFFQSSMVVEADGDCKPQCPSYQMSSLPMYSPLGHFTSDVAASAPGLVGETIPDLSLTDSPPDSNSIFSCGSSPEHQQNQQLEEEPISPQPIMAKEQRGVHHEYPQSGLKQPNTYSFTQRFQHGQDTAVLNNTLKEDNIKRALQTRKCHPNHKVPDLSKVKPRVSFPKGDYQPPKSRWPSKNPPKSLSPETPVVLKSPADIVKDVLLNTTDGPHTPFDFHEKTLTGSPEANVPQEFRCQQETGILLDQLQEKHGLLLTKYAEAANTIDRLRLEPKVNLYSEQPKPAQVMPLQVQVEPSKFMQLDFPQAQKAQPSTLSPQPNEQSTPKRAPTGLSLSASISKSAEWQGSQKVANSLYAKADKFLQKLQHFEDLLNNKTPFHQVKSFAELGQVLRSLEKGYLSAKKKHKELQEQGAKPSQFDPNRELEEFIYQCGRHMDDLKEVVDRRAREVDSASPCLQAQQISPSDDSQSESRHTPMLVHPVETPQKEVQIVPLSSSNSKKRCAEQAMDVKDGSTVCLTPTTHIMRKEVRKSYSSSQSSLAEMSTSMKRSAKLQTGNGRVLSQDRVISPGTDSGFVGSEYSHHIWAAASCSFQQGASKCNVRPPEASPKKPQASRSSSRSRESPQPQRRTPIPAAEYFQQAMRRLYPEERKSKHWARSQTDSTRTDSESANTASEDAQSDQCEENHLCSSPNSSSSALRHHHGDTPKAARSSQVVTCNDPSRLLQAIKSIRPNGENNCHSVPNSTQGNCNDHRNSHPLSGSRKKWTIGGEAEQVVRRIARKRLTHRHQAQAETSTATEDEQFSRRILVSRSTQTSILVAESQNSHSVHVQHMKQNCVSCVTDNVGRKSSGPSGSPRVSHPNLSCEKTAGGNQEPPHFASCRSHYCRHCGHSETKTANEQDCRSTSSPILSNGQPTVSLSKAPPQPAMCPTPLLLYLQPQSVHMCTNNTSSPPDLISSKKEERSQHLPCVVPQRCLDDSLLAAREMKDRSDKMVRSLNTALRSLERLSKSRSGFHSN
ncbi:uncharacterized protein akna isoform X2 [Stigmatopora nigra]